MKIGLALSGGGFRATLYHLGMIRFLRDAKILLRVDGNVDYILVGPCTPNLAPQAAASELSGMAPKAATLQLGADFSARRKSRA